MRFGAGEGAEVAEQARSAFSAFSTGVGRSGIGGGVGSGGGASFYGASSSYFASSPSHYYGAASGASLQGRLFGGFNIPFGFGNGGGAAAAASSMLSLGVLSHALDHLKESLSACASSVGATASSASSAAAQGVLGVAQQPLLCACLVAVLAALVHLPPVAARRLWVTYQRLRSGLRSSRAKAIAGRPVK